MDEIDKWQKAIDKAATSLHRVVKEARREHPEAFIYLEASGYLHLMSGPAHTDGPGGDSHREFILTSTHVFGFMDGGEW